MTNSITLYVNLFQLHNHLSIDSFSKCIICMHGGFRNVLLPLSKVLQQSNDENRQEVKSPNKYPCGEL